ncbi:hypothetical protein GBAR_LOCUS29998, partial [Geodia barretti]
MEFQIPLSARTSSGRREAPSSSYQSLSQPERSVSRLEGHCWTLVYCLHSRVFPCLLQSST